MKNNEYKYLGPHGPLFLILVLPVIVMGLIKALDLYRNYEHIDENLNFGEILKEMKEFPILTPSSLFAVLAWTVLQGMLYKYLPGEEALGLPVDNNEPLIYPINGVSSLIATILIITMSYILHGKQLFLWVADNIWQLCKASFCISLIFSSFIHCYSYRKNASIIKNNDTKFFIYDLWMGRELNPRLFGIDLKHFFYTRIGLMFTLFLSLSFFIKNYHLDCIIGVPQLLILILQTLYVFVTLYSEQSLLSTSYATKEGLGYMLCLDSYLIMPFLYSIHQNYLITRPVYHSKLSIYVITLVNIIGLYLLQSSNNQKDYFHRSIIADKNTIEPKNYRIAKDGIPLLFTGWWGLARHINYFGYWLIMLSTTLLTNSYSLIPYSGLIFLTIILVHRQYLIEHNSKIKKGSIWREYNRVVPWRFVPYIF